MMDMKRIAALLMALCLVFQLVPAPAGAAEAPGITVSSAEAYPGNSCYIDIEASGLSNLASLDLEIYYDSEILTLSSVTNGILLADSLASVNDETVGVVKLSAAWLSGVNGSGRILRLQFQVNSDAPAGSSRILVAVGDAHDVNLNHVHISGGTGTVTVPERPDNMGSFQVGTYFPNGSVFQQGDTVTVVMTNSGSHSFASADFKLEYDSELFRVESVKLRNALANEGAVYSVNTDIAGIAKVSYASVEPVSSYFLMDFVLTVIADVDATSTVTVSAADVYTVDLVPYTPVAGTGTVTLEKKPDVPDYPDLYLTDLPTTVGQEGTTLLVLEEGAGVSAADFTVKYDTAVYQCLGVTAAEGLSAKGGMVVINPGYGKGTVKFSYINENGTDEAVNLVQIRWKCLASPEEHTQVLTGATGVVDAAYAAVKLDLIPFSECIFAEFHEDPTCTEEGGEGLMCYACGEQKDVTVFPATGHHYGTVVTPPTCTEQGFTTYTCPDCGDSYVDDYVAILPHAYESVVTPPTCTEQGFTTYTCPDCGHSYVDDYTAATGHSFGDWYTVVAATCTETGIRKHDCWNCDHSETEELEALGHAYENGICIRCGAPETFLEEGKCGDTLYWRMGEDGTLTIFGTGAMYDFDYSETGPWNGYKDSITKVLVQEGATSVGQNAFRGYKAITELVLPETLQILNYGCFNACEGLTCVELTGDLKQIGNSVFSNCSNLESVTLPEGLESIGDQAFSSCNNLKGIVIPDSVSALGSFVFSNCRNLEYANIPEGITELGTMAFFSCRSLREIVIPESMKSIGDYAFRYCDALTSVVIPAGVDSVNRWAFDDCKLLEEIYVYSTHCTFAEESLDAEAVVFCYEESTAHIYAVENGLNYCAVPEGEALGHSHYPVVTEPTCTEDGFTTWYCAYCGASYTSDPVAALGHDFGEWETTVEATCTGDGQQRRDCSRCDHFETQTVSKLGHDYKSTVTDPTCTEDGYTTHTCSRCDDSYTDTPVAALGHDWDDGMVTVEPTEDTAGEMLYTCARCGETKTEVIPELGHEHSYEAVVTAPTCTERGYTTYTCRCGDSYVSDYVDAMGHDFGDWETTVEATCTEEGEQRRECARCGHVETQTVEALGHDYVDGVCTRCGEKDPGYVEPDPGTANVIRLSGKNRYDTAFAVANQLKKNLGITQFGSVVVAYGQNFPDALTGSYLAAMKNAPILLTEKSADARVLAYIEENLVPGGTVYILGGTAAVTQEFEDGAKERGFTVKRLKDKNRYGTNLKILEEAGVNQTDEILIATGTNYADSLSASATGLPMLLVGGSLTEEQKAFLKNTSGRFVIIGGTGAVSQKVEDQLNEIGTAERVKGKTRYETSVVIAQRYFGSPKAAVLAYAQGFPDGLCGGPLAMNMGAPLILTSNESPAAADAYIEGITVGAVTGGTGRITDDTVRAIFDLAEDTEIPIP